MAATLLSLMSSDLTAGGGVRALTARHAVVVATGSDPVIPDVPGLALARPWTNREATSAQQIPKRLVTIGNGPVACEMSQALHSLGADESIVLVYGDRLLFNPAAVEKALAERAAREVVRHG